ncbi:MAG TPA: regulatory iron-sulfur-containing complex subunit RicT [Gemmatimonadaceae bacterium]|jgi:cell fate regulator YaaT (PSP1 superfamily)|nr:regulatory iron-sulfur-containing complex subunit RicT [Gemmatimonadaceae bacterium]
MPHLVEVAFKGNRKEFFLWDYPDPPALNAAVIVDVDRGEDLGYVHALGELAEKRNNGCAHGCGTALPERKALRLATEKDRGMSKDLERLNEEARRKAMERVRANGLGMKLSDAEWQWDRKKLTLYFTADKRVDFRNLVRDLASLFRTRIELKQIGVRDEAKRLDGIGRCGRQYCSASWLPELRPVNLGVAKDQRLSLNPSQISGACGRLMCCLRYEHDFYVQSRKRFPKEGKIVATRLGEEKVVSVDIFRERITLRGVEGEMRVLTLAEFKDETEHALGNGVTPVAEVDEDLSTDPIRPDEISPELLYTAEHQVLTLPAKPTPAPPPSPTTVREGEGPSRRRRGRRGGRRGRGEDSQSGNQ